MSSAAEAAGARPPLASDLKAGTDAISANEKVTFTKYVQKVLPADGYVFWVRGDLASPPQPGTKVLDGSFHYATTQNQNEDESFSVNQVIFTAESDVDNFNDIDPTTLYIATYEGIEFAFSSRGNFYKQAQLWHYRGNAVYADMQTQLIKTPEALAALGPLIVSNSLPVWLSLNAFTPNWPFYPGLPLPFDLYPSFLVPNNLVPQWGAVHIGHDDTTPIASAPFFQPSQSQEQLSYDHVRVTLWGLNNSEALNFAATVNQFSKDTGLIGIMNQPIIADAKRTQSELGVIAQKKIIEYDVSYLQSKVADFARQLIVRATLSFFPG